MAPFEVDVLAPRQLRVEAGAHLQQRADPAADSARPVVRLGDAGQDLQQRALARAVAADDAEHLARRTSNETSLSAQSFVDRVARTRRAGTAPRHFYDVSRIVEYAPCVAEHVVFSEPIDADRDFRASFVRRHPRRPVPSRGRRRADKESPGDSARSRSGVRPGQVVRRTGPTEALDDPGHRIQAVEPAGNPSLGELWENAARR